MKRTDFFLGVIFMFILNVTPSLAQEDAKALFRQNCASCHSIEQDLVGPALKGVTERRDSAWLYGFIINSQEMIQAGDPIAVELFNRFNKVPMPSHPHLSTEEITAILNHIDSEAEEAASQTASTHPIPRPEEFYGANYRQFTFGDMIFWIPMTITVLLLIATLVGFTYANDALKEARKEVVVPQEEL
ncbi:cytochrome c [Membranicola marinus]|uniref:Cytochrome c n=1 Tax=Membranihabitans marinus TaxID=1227546 RepID=A0A953HNE0_9BACT|nr:cytochrome c [Membranihabitans marinus]MBY5958807.1 cytochrome c [Membranihabitans marinus]